MPFDNVTIYKPGPEAKVNGFPIMSGASLHELSRDMKGSDVPVLFEHKDIGRVMIGRVRIEKDHDGTERIILEAF